MEDSTTKLRELEASYQTRLSQQDSSFKVTLDSYMLDVARLETLLAKERTDF
jgi:hypothetical protein